MTTQREEKQTLGQLHFVKELRHVRRQSFTWAFSIMRNTLICFVSRFRPRTWDKQINPTEIQIYYKSIGHLPWDAAVLQQRQRNLLVLGPCLYNLVSTRYTLLEPIRYRSIRHLTRILTNNSVKKYGGKVIICKKYQMKLLLRDMPRRTRLFIL